MLAFIGNACLKFDSGLIADSCFIRVSLNKFSSPNFDLCSYLCQLTYNNNTQTFICTIEQYLGNLPMIYKDKIKQENTRVKYQQL